MEIVLICLCPLICLLLPIKVRKNGLFSLITVGVTAAVTAVEVIIACNSSDFHAAAFAFQLFIPAQLITLALTLIVGNLMISAMGKRAENKSENDTVD